MARRALLVAMFAILAPASAFAQDTTTRLVAADSARPAGGWNDARTIALVRRATALRAMQLADTGLRDYRATAHGYLTFLAQLGEGFTEPPKVVKADELALEVYWKAPDRSRQQIVGRRDTLLLPTDINYHRDHLGIVQNNFPDIIRLGDGDEVLDVPHPLSPAGLAAYDFAIGDSVRIRLPDRVINVLAVRVRPRDDRRPRAVGAVFIDTAEAQVVRMAFSFTRSALKDEQLEDVSIVLENALVASRFWLPRRQEIEIRRTGSFLDYPARGIIRGRWEICCYEVNQGLDDRLFVGGHEITQAPPRVLRAHRWDTPRLLDSLPPDVRAVTDEDVRKVQQEARELVRAQALARARRPALSARAVSDFVKVDRAEGLALGAGLVRAFGRGIAGAVRGRYGIADRELKGQAALEWRRASGAGLGLEAYRDYRDASDVPEVSRLRNSIAAQEAGSDYTEPYDVRGVTAWVALPSRWGLRPRLAIAFETHDSVTVAARPEHGRYERTIPADPLDAGRIALRLSRPTALAWLGTEVRLDAELRATQWTVAEAACADAGCPPRPFPHGRHESGRATVDLGVERPVGRQRLVLRTVAAGAVGPLVPVQELAYAGGPTTGPGYRYHEFAGRLVASQRLEWQLPMPFVAVPLGRFGRTAPQATFAPFAQVVYVARGEAAAPFQPVRRGWYPAVGVGSLVLFDLLRFDVARGLRDGRWTFSVDAARAFWPVL